LVYVVSLDPEATGKPAPKAVTVEIAPSGARGAQARPRRRLAHPDALGAEAAVNAKRVVG
jgi:hypothetical protein